MSCRRCVLNETGIRLGVYVSINRVYSKCFYQSCLSLSSTLPSSLCGSSRQYASTIQGYSIKRQRMYVLAADGIPEKTTEHRLTFLNLSPCRGMYSVQMFFDIPVRSTTQAFAHVVLTVPELALHVDFFTTPEHRGCYPDPFIAKTCLSCVKWKRRLYSTPLPQRLRSGQENFVIGFTVVDVLIYPSRKNLQDKMQRLCRDLRRLCVYVSINHYSKCFLSVKA
jgi:hypothetical protein